MRIGIATKPNLVEATETLCQLDRWLRGRAEAVWANDASALLPEGPRHAVERSRLPHAVDLVVVLGGDGTLLAMANHIAAANVDVPILGVNFGSLGFLTEVRRPELFTSLEAALAGRATYDERMMLSATLRENGHEGSPDLTRASTVPSPTKSSPASTPAPGSPVALNDIVFTRTALSRMVELDVSVGGQFVATIKADGLIVASPTGSTAYNLSAGGPIVHPAMNAMVLTPIAPHTLTNRPIVIPAGRDVHVSPTGSGGSADVYVTFDGQSGFPLQPRDELAIGRAARPLRLVRAPARSYFEVLREKLKWNER
jgi:NAD+ kinase